jgi:hypothetical protein
MDGTALCELINVLRPGMIPKIHHSPILMFRRENFGFFQHACLKLGCHETETCVFEDVYDDKNMGLFLINIIALARNTQYEPGYQGPILSDAARNSGQDAAAPSEPKCLGISVADQAALQAHENKVHAHSVDQGIIQPTDQTAVPENAPGAYLGPTAAEQAAAHGEGVRNASRYVQHGIVVNPDENPANIPR